MSQPPEDRAKILVVDDRPGNLLSLKALLERPDYEIVLANSGEEALDQILRNDFAVILLDVAMPVLDGFETAALIKQRERSRKVPIIFVTASVYDMEHVFRGYTVGAVDYLQKPVDAHAVRAKVAVFVELFRQGRQIERQAERLHQAERRERAAIERRAAEAIEDSEEQYRATFDQAPVGIGHVAIDGRFARVNARLCEMLGNSPDELLSLRLQTVATGDDGREVDRALHDLVAGRRDRYAGEHRFHHRDGSVRLLELTLSLQRDRDARPKHLILVAQDATERRRVEDALRASEGRFRRLAESGLVGVFFWRVDTGAITDANDAFLGMVGATREDLEAGRLDVERLAAQGRGEADQRALAELRRSGVFQTYEKELVRPDGRRVAVLLGGASVDAEAGLAVDFVVDVTERRQIEHERTRLIRELREAVRARDDFLAIAAHELKTPLTPLRLQVDGLVRAVAKNGVQAVQPDRLAMIEKAVARIEMLIENLLDVSRVTVGRLRIEHEVLDLVKVARDVVERHRTEGERAGCSIALTVAASSVMGQWDRVRVEQVLTNVLQNAIKYGAGKPIEMSVDKEDDVARVVVRDYGIGMPVDEQQRIFERFERLVPVRHYGGFGLGLWIVRQIVEAHGGSIDVWSRPGEGARFTIALPRRATAHRVERGDNAERADEPSSAASLADAERERRPN